MLNSRLLACAGMVQGNVICDVGTDHALLPVYLVQNQIAEKAFACDVREGPLRSAEGNIKKNNLSDKIYMILSDGLQSVPPEGITDIIIAGMGGETIIHILETCPFSLEKINLILQPMTKAELLRQWLFENGFAVQKEICIPDKNFLYAVMQGQFTGEKRIPDAGEIYFGKMDLQTLDGRAYAEHVLVQLRKANFHSVPERSEIIRKLEEMLISI